MFVQDIVSLMHSDISIMSVILSIWNRRESISLMITQIVLGVRRMKTEFIKNSFDEFLQCQYEKISETNLKVILPVQPLFLNTVGVVNGGIICLFADIAMGNACNTFGIEENNRQTVVTV